MIVNDITDEAALAIAYVRIAELEAERDKWKELAHLRGDHSVERAKTAIARIAELEALAERRYAEGYDMATRLKAERIAELEAEVHHFKTEYQDTASRAELAARIAELEADNALISKSMLARVAELEAQLAGKAVNVADPMEWARQIVLAERETCAMYVEALAQKQGGGAVVYRQCAAVIRARPAP